MNKKKKTELQLSAEEIVKRVRQAQVPQKDYVATMTTEQGFETCADICGSLFICLNELADSCMVDAIARLSQDKKLWRHEIKREARHAQGLLRLNIAHATTHVKQGNKSFYYEYVDAYVENMKKDVDIFYWSIVQELTKADYGKDSEILAHVEVVNVLLLLICKGYGEMIEYIRKGSNTNLSSVFSAYQPIGASHAWTRLTDMVFMRYRKGKDIDLNKSKEVSMAYQILQKRLVYGDFLDESAMASLEANMDKMDEDTLREYEEIKERLNK